MKSKTLTALILLLFVLAACNTSKKSDNAGETDTLAAQQPQISLESKWETDTVLTTCESVVYDDGRDVLYVSDIEGTPDEKDGKGAISQVNLDGSIKSRDWITGLDAPKGMAISNGKLYVSDIDQIVEIDIEGGKVLNKYPVEGAKFLNDVAVADDGVVYVSDTQANNIVKLENGNVSIYMDSVGSPNGLYVESGKLLTAFSADQMLKSIDMDTKEITEIAGDLPNPDGIEATGDGGYLVSNWAGEVAYVSPDGEKEILLDTKSQNINSADIEFIPAKNLLLVPGFFANKVMAYELVKK